MFRAVKTTRSAWQIIHTRCPKDGERHAMDSVPGNTNNCQENTHQETTTDSLENNHRLSAVKTISGMEEAGV